METIQPISRMANSGCLSPTRRMTQSAMVSAAPVFSRKKPIIAPRMMTMPSEENVPEKPAPMVPGTLASGSASSARISDTPMMDRNG